MLNVYDAGILKSFEGMTLLEDYIFICVLRGSEEHCDECHADTHYMKTRNLKSFIIKCITSLLSCETKWDGKISHNNISISAIPAFYNGKTDKLIVLTPKKNGNSYLISSSTHTNSGKEYPRFPPRKNITSEQLIEFFEKSVDIVESIFDPVMERLDKLAMKNDKQHNETGEQSSKVVNVVLKDVEKPRPIISEKDFDKFNLQNYERVR